MSCTGWCKVDQFASPLSTTYLLRSWLTCRAVLAMCFSAVPPSSSSSTSVMFGSEWRSVCAEGEMNVQEIMDALHVALIPSPDSQTSFPPSPDLKFLLASKLGVNICNKTTHLYIVSVLNAHCVWHGNEGYNWGPRMGMRLHVGYHSAPMPGITCTSYSNGQFWLMANSYTLHQVVQNKMGVSVKCLLQTTREPRRRPHLY